MVRRSPQGGPIAPTHFQGIVTTLHEAIFGPASPKVGLAITSLTVDNRTSSDGALLFLVIHGELRGGGCNDLVAGVEDLTDVAVPSGETVHLDFPEPLVAGSEQAWCLVIPDNQSPGLRITTVGFTF